MLVDIYNVDAGIKLIGNARIPGIVSDVLPERLTGAEVPDIVFRFEGGQLQYIDILRFSGGKARQVFQYGASTIKIVSEPKPVIEATSRVADITEHFTWNSRRRKFEKIDPGIIDSSHFRAERR